MIFIRDMSTNAARVVISSILALVVSSVHGNSGSKEELSVSDKVNIIAQVNSRLDILTKF